MTSPASYFIVNNENHEDVLEKLYEHLLASPSPDWSFYRNFVPAYDPSSNREYEKELEPSVEIHNSDVVVSFDISSLTPNEQGNFLENLTFVINEASDNYPNFSSEDHQCDFRFNFIIDKIATDLFRYRIYWESLRFH